MRLGLWPHRMPVPGHVGVGTSKHAWGAALPFTSAYKSVLVPSP